MGGIVRTSSLILQETYLVWTSPMPSGKMAYIIELHPRKSAKHGGN
jgi:hypothetical protein